MSLILADTPSLLERVASLEAENRLLRRLLDQHQHAPAQREREQRRTEIAENLSRIGTWEWSADTDRSTLSHGLRRLLLLTDDAPAPTVRGLLRLLPAHDRQRLIIRLRRLRAEGANFVQEFSLTRNVNMRLRAAGIAEFDAQRRLSRLFVVVQDITAVWTEARARRHLELRWHQLINTCPDAVLISRLGDGRIVDCNQVAAELLGYSVDEMLGRSPAELHLWTDLDQQRQIWQLILHPGKPAAITIRDAQQRDIAVEVYLRIAEMEDERFIVAYTRPRDATRPTVDAGRSLPAG